MMLSVSKLNVTSGQFHHDNKQEEDMYENVIKPSRENDMDHVENPYVSLPEFAELNKRYQAYLKDTEVGFIGKLWGYSRTHVCGGNVLLCVLIPVVIFSIMFRIGLLPVGIVCATLWVLGGLYALNNCKYMDTASMALSQSITAEERVALALILRDLTDTDPSLIRYINRPLQSTSDEIRKLFEGCKKNLFNDLRELSLALIYGKTDNNVSAAVVFLFCDMKPGPQYWWDFLIVGQTTFIGCLTRFAKIERHDLWALQLEDADKASEERLASL